MPETLINLFLQILGGVIGGNVAAIIGGKNIDLGNIGLNAFVGMIGGVVGGQIFAALMAGQSNKFDLVGIVGQLLVGIVVGALIITHVGLLNNKLLK